MASQIEWTDETVNVVTGCTPCSPGCARCYAKSYAARLHGAGLYKYRNNFKPTFHPELLNEPGKWKKPKRIFLISMGDLFHPEIRLEDKQKVFHMTQRYPHHTCQILTKRAEQLLEAAPYLPWPKNVQMGVTIESDEYTYRAELLKQVPAAIKFVSLEPLLGPLPSLNLDGLDWVIVGGERAPGARIMKKEWVTPIRVACARKSISFFFKQWGSATKTNAQGLLDGKIFRNFPEKWLSNR